ncbi:MAG: FUSC family protein, partial [Planctomycetota bacterium]
TRIKEAIKTGLAMAVVYWIALRMGWMNPYWAAFSIAMISLPTQGQSLNKGVERMGGTLVGCPAALLFLALFPQDRWLFFTAVTLYCGVVTYLMTGRKLNYFWFVAGFVCLIVTLAGPESPENVFQYAVMRTTETAMGITVWTLISVFLWPQTNVGTLKKVSRELMTTQISLYGICRDLMLRKGSAEEFPKLRTQEVSLLGKLGGAIKAEGAESYEVHEVRRLWQQLHVLSSAFMEALERWQQSFAEIAHVETTTILPDLDAYCAELDRRFGQIQQMLNEQPPDGEPRAVTLGVNRDRLRALPHFDRAAAAVAVKGIQRIESLTGSLFECVRDLKGYGEHARTVEPATKPTREPRLWLPTLDPDRVRASIMVMATVVVSVLIWIYVDPPGHAAIYQFAPTLAFVIAQNPWGKATVLLKPFAVAFLFGMAAYVFIMPRLSTYVELGTLIFAFSFVVAYFFPGLGRLAGLVAMINMMSIQNQQTYSFAAAMNSYLFVMLALCVPVATSYLTFSPRPEKAFLRLLERFFRSCEFVMSRMAWDASRSRFAKGWVFAFHRRELATLPQKLGTWGRVIDHKLFPANSPEQVQALVIGLEALAHRLDELIEARRSPQADLLVRELLDDIRAWRLVVQQGFRRLAESPDLGPAAEFRQRLTTRLATLETRIIEAFEKAGERELGEKDYENFYGLLGGYRGVSEAAVAFVGVAENVKWAQWRESRF